MRILTTKEFNEKINNGDKFIVDFFSDRCGPCYVLGPIMEKAANKLEDDTIEICKFDVDHDRELSMGLGIRAIPTIKAFSGGKEVHTSVGILKEEAILDIAKSMK